MTPSSNYDSQSGRPPLARAGEGEIRENVGALDLLLDIELPLTIRFGTTRMPLGELLELAPGSVIDLDSAIESGVEILVNGKVVARGTAVTVGDNYGVRISEIAAAREGFVPAPGAPAVSAGEN